MTWTAPIIQRSQPGTQTVDLGSGFCPYTMVDRTQRLALDKGPITHIWLYAESPGFWRPRIVRRPSVNSSIFVTVYDYPESTAHPGGGWRSIALPAFLWLNGGVHYPAAYMHGFADSPVTHVTIGRAWAYGDVGSIAQFTTDGVEDTRRAPCMGVTYTPTPPRYFQDFDRATDFDGWGSVVTGASPSISNSAFSSQSSYWDDTNHADIAGTLSLLAYHYGFGATAPNGTWVGTDLTNARIMMRARWFNWVPQQSRLRMLIQAIPAADPSKRAPYVCETLTFDQYADGNWHEIDFMMPEASAWTFAGGSDIYVQMDPALVLQNIHNIHFPAIRPNGTAAPTGRFDLDWFRIV